MMITYPLETFLINCRWTHTFEKSALFKLIINLIVTVPMFQMYTFCDSRYELWNGTMNNPPIEVLHEEAVDHGMNHVCNRQSAWQVLRQHEDFYLSKYKSLVW